MKGLGLGFLIGLSCALGLSFLAGENPWDIATILWRATFGSGYDFGVALFYTTPLLFTGLSVAVALRAGLFNIGAEGQLLMGCAAAAGWGVLVPAFPGGFVIALFVGLLTAGLWGALAGWLRAIRGAHEVIVTILLNFIAAALSGWFILQVIPNPDSQNPESALIAPAYRLNDLDPLRAFFPDTGTSLALPVGLLLCFLFWWIFRRTRWGYELLAVGENSEAARRGGIPVERRRIEAMLVAGTLAGGVALSEILAHNGQFKIGFSPDYGFIGIAVALIARGHPVGLIAAAFLMGSLHKGAAELDVETDSITRDFSKILQALIILGVCTQSVWQKLFSRRPR